MDFKGWPVDYSQLFAFSMPGIPVFLAVEGPERFPAFWVASGRLPSLTGRKSKIRRIEKQKAGTLPGHFPKKPLSHFGGDKDTAADPPFRSGTSRPRTGSDNKNARVVNGQPDVEEGRGSGGSLVRCWRRGA
jgi:hypothetical protein